MAVSEQLGWGCRVADLGSIVRAPRRDDSTAEHPPLLLCLGQAQEERESLECGERCYQNAAEKLRVCPSGFCTAVLLEGEKLLKHWPEACVTDTSF